jgi:hypothetical protein
MGPPLKTRCAVNSYNSVSPILSTPSCEEWTGHAARFSLCGLGFGGCVFPVLDLALGRPHFTVLGLLLMGLPLKTRCAVNSYNSVSPILPLRVARSGRGTLRAFRFVGLGLGDVFSLFWTWLWGDPTSLFWACF